MASSPAIFLRKLSLTSSGGGGGTTTTVTKTVKFIKYLLHYPSHINLSRNIAKVTSFKEGDVFLYSELVPTNDILDLNYTLDVINNLVSTNPLFHFLYLSKSQFQEARVRLLEILLP